MSYEFFIALRYLKAKRRPSFVSVISFISILGITVGVTALIIVLSVMTGFEDDLKEKILGINAHIVVMEPGGAMSGYGEVTDKVKGVEGVLGATPFIYSQAMLSYRGGVVGVVVRGLDLATVGDVTVLPERIREGTLGGLKDSFEDGPPGIVIGSELAKNLVAGVGDEVNVISPMARAAGVGAVPRLAAFKVAGIFETGMFEYDSSLAFISIDNAQRFFKLGDTVTGVEVKISDIYRAGETGQSIEDELGGGYWTRTWEDMNRNLFSALRLEKVTMFIILTLIILVAALNIISTLIMVVMEKGKDIAILKSMGATSGGIMKIFMIEGSVIGVVGAISGTILGLLAALNLEAVVEFFEWLFDFKVLPPSVYYIDKLPSKVEPTVVIIIVLISIGISFLATIYPSWRASRFDPVEGLR
jgi:lipoprotein-releasing system permease protein